jgi:hypothetical protein
MTMQREVKIWLMQLHRKVAYAVLLGLFIFALQHPCAAQKNSTTSVDTDRWIEIDLYWVNLHSMAGSVHEFWDRFQPLFAGVQGYRGVILNIGWTVGPVMEWSGNLDQRISLPTGSGESRWVGQHGPLTGTTAERMQKWNARFAGPELVKRHGYDPWTYGDVKLLIADLKQEAARRDITGLKVGMLNFAWTKAYGEEAAWVRRHPEAFTEPDNCCVSKVRDYFDPAAHLHADTTPLGGLPHGIVEGTPVYQAYAAQWGSLSQSLGMDAIMLRDSFGTPVPYQRSGPWGAVAPSPDVIRKATDAVAAPVNETKLANPNALVMMYSNGASAVSDWRSNGLDLETIAKQGYLDVWVDQTWAGAWNEVGIREGTFWSNSNQGWTYQLAYMLTHASILADTKVRHYPVVETFDAWESQDVIHTAPERLRWGIWAYSHAAVKTPTRLKMPAGSYISWANNGEHLLDKQDVRFLADNINAAVADAQQTTTVFGPTLVYSRDAMQWQIDHASPDHDINEWINEQTGSVAKWPVPILSATRIEWLPKVQSDLFIIRTPSNLSSEHLETLRQLIKSGHPVALLGSFAGGIDESLLRLAGLSGSSASKEGKVRLCKGKAMSRASELVSNIPLEFYLYCRPENFSLSTNAHVIYTADGSPALTLDADQRTQIALWDAPDLRSSRRSVEQLPLSQIWGNTGAPYALPAGVLNELLQANSDFHVNKIDLKQTMNITAWRAKDGRLRILAGNLEEGLRDDADLSRHATLVMPRSWRIETWKDAWTGHKFYSKDGRLQIDLPQGASVLLEPNENGNFTQTRSRPE